MLYELNQSQFKLDFHAPEDRSQAKVLVFWQKQVLSVNADYYEVLDWQKFQQYKLRSTDQTDILYLGATDDVPWFAWQMPDQENFFQAGNDLIPFEIRAAAQGSETTFAMMSRAMQLFRWQEDHQYCGRCGSATELLKHERGARCPSCELVVYPRISPCVIVLITRGEEVLLAKGIRWKDSDWYSTLAGFIEAGESAEQAVHREVMEEVGIKIKNLQYQNSQTWPFPHQLMLGYEAEYDSGDIVIDEQEIVDAQWWHIDDLPKYSKNFSISGYLVDNYLKKMGREA